MSKNRDAAVAAVHKWLDWSARTGTLAATIANHVVDSVIHALGRSIDPDGAGWHKIESLPEGEHVILYWQEGEKGVGGTECATVFFNEDGEWSYWTHGGPNAGCDFEPRDGERPSHWMSVPLPPTPSADKQ